MENLFFENTKTKTRIAISGGDEKRLSIDIVLHVANFLGREIDFVKNGEQMITQENDFIIFEVDEENTKFLKYKPNIAYFCGTPKNLDIFQQFLETITSGGVLIFSEDDEVLTTPIENASNYFRKIPFKKPQLQTAGNQILIDTDFGKIPLNFSENQIPYVEGSRLICQQLGIQEEEFYEALISFDF